MDPRQDDMHPVMCRDRVHNKGEEPAPAKAKGGGWGGGKPKDMTKKAVLLSGPPGIGKTSSATIITR